MIKVGQVRLTESEAASLFPDLLDHQHRGEGPSVLKIVADRKAQRNGTARIS